MAGEDDRKTGLVARRGERFHAGPALGQYLVAYMVSVEQQGHSVRR